MSLRHVSRKLFVTLALLSLLPFDGAPSLAVPSGPTGHRHALLIGISDYHEYNSEGLFPDLDCDEDIHQMAVVLKGRFGFTDSEITKLNTPKQTRRAAILAALDRLTAQAGPGDLIFIHYSGHGDQVMDPSEPSGFDSSIVPCDYKTPPPNKKTDATTNEIAGTTIRGYLQRLRAKVGTSGEIVMAFDSCHSASAARSGIPAKKRGISYKDYVRWYKARHPEYQGDSGPASLGDPHTMAGDEVRSRGGQMLVRPKPGLPPPPPPTRGGQMLVRPKPGLPPPPPSTRGGQMLVRGTNPGNAWGSLDGVGYVVLSACRSEDCAFECHDDKTDKDMGRFTYCLTQVLSQAGPQTTYREVYNQVDAMFRSKFDDQFPQVDGDPDHTLFGGAATGPPSAFVVTRNASGAPTIEVGSLQDMSAGSVFKIYARDATAFDAGTWIATAKVTKTELTKTTLTVTDMKPGLKPDALNAALAVEWRHNYASPPVSLDPESVRTAVPDQAAAILEELKTYNMVRTTKAAGEKWDYVLTRETLDPGGRGEKTLVLASADTKTPTDDVLTETGDTPLAEQVAKDLRNHAKYRYACALGKGQAGLNPSYHVDLRLLRITANGIDPNPISSHALTVGDHYVIQARNRSKVLLHLSILDITSDGTVNPLWPGTGEGWNRDSNRIPAQSGWRTLWIGSDVDHKAHFTAKIADAGEVFKVIATNDFVDFAALGTRGPQGPFEALIAPGIRGNAMDEAAVEDPGAWTVSSVPVTVTEAAAAGQ